jgi:hypothetical protein
MSSQTNGSGRRPLFLSTRSASKSRSVQPRKSTPVAIIQGLEEDDPGGVWIPNLGWWDMECCLEQQDDGFLEIMYMLRLYCLFVLGFCFDLFLYFCL